MGVFRQVICTLIACYVGMSLGITFAWPSGTLQLFESNTTVLDRPMNKVELSLFGSLSSIGALVSTPVVGVLLDVVGRKYCAMGSMMMHVLCWTLIMACSKVEAILAAIFISGVGGGAALVVPVYISEICQENIRGTMTSGSMIAYGIGMLMSYAMGGTVSYMTFVYISMSIAVMGMVLLTFTRETPLFLMKKGLEEEAAKSFAFYRSASVGSKEVISEMEKLRRAFNAELDEELTDIGPEAQKLYPQLKEPTGVKQIPRQKPSLWQFLRRSRSTWRAAFVVITLCTAAIFQGLVVLQVYAEPLFKQAVPNVSPTLCCVILAVVTVISGFLAAYLTDVAGRRYLMIYSSIAAGLCCVVLGSQLHMLWAADWVTAVFIYLFTAAYTFGAGTVPFVLMAEVFSPEVKSFMSMFVIEWAWLCNFVILFIFNPLVEAVGLGPTFYMFAAVCIATAVFAWAFQPETKGLTVAEIQTLFSKRR
ncbi:sugar transporter domain-containing protein [Phthorimaea operculella]|nr:sugar transporter domain-containing protein [Phthorimaea operculella]